MKPSTFIFLASTCLCHAADVSTTPSTITSPPSMPSSTSDGVTSASPTSSDTGNIWDSISSMMKPPPPYIPQDPWYCAKENYSAYFLPPTPTGALFTHMVGFAGSEIQKTCTTKFLSCSDLGLKEWCDYTTKAPASFSSALSSLGSAASSWSLAHSSGLAVLPTACPDSWAVYGAQFIGRDVWTNRSKNFAECYRERYGSSPVSLGSSSTEVPSRVLQPTSSNGA
ncbi:hypothetical protein NLG97_g2807 [Lecanicillium saksenae]|uniref:Uncharacterized protein n=1 Tax=Lecanicillium saksenae TaxID=468837 RepID=A0ACC1R1N1_9HYPO|nr:hypothetical protein NLG97_g2807 [Lecanicillium saksenae]